MEKAWSMAIGLTKDDYVCVLRHLGVEGAKKSEHSSENPKLRSKIAWERD